MKLIIAILIVIQPLFGMEWAFKGSFNKKDPIGVRTYHFFDEKRNRPVVAEFWYPIEQRGLLLLKMITLSGFILMKYKGLVLKVRRQNIHLF